MTTYNIKRMYASDKASRIVRRGLTLEEAIAHCRDPKTSSRTATSAKAKAHTKRFGDWFDGYGEEKRKRGGR